jgi:hypothetical protein
MTQRIFGSTLLALALLLGGCASVPVERGKDLSSAGIAYAKATAAVIELAIDAALDASSEDRAEIRRGTKVPAASDKPEDKAAREALLKKLEADLTRSDERLVTTVHSYLRLKRSVSAVEAYFQGLAALSGANPAAATEKAVESLMKNVAGLSKALESGHTIKPDQQSAVAGLAGLIVKQAHGAAIARALERDAEVIGRALVLQELALDAAVGDINANLALAADEYYRDKVRRPYLDGNVGSGWVDARRTALRTRALGTSDAAVRSASAAARQMQAVWGRILAGETSGEEFLRMLKDVQELLDAAIALKKAS